MYICYKLLLARPKRERRRGSFISMPRYGGVDKFKNEK